MGGIEKSKNKLTITYSKLRFLVSKEPIVFEIYNLKNHQQKGGMLDANKLRLAMQSRLNSLASEQSVDRKEGAAEPMLPNAEELNRQLGALAANGTERITEEDSMERKMILNIIYANDYYSLMNNRGLVIDKNINWLEPHSRTDLDELISPLTCAAFLSRSDIVQLLLQNHSLDLEMTTLENEYTALMAACMAGSLEVVSMLAENGADVNAMNSLG